MKIPGAQCGPNLVPTPPFKECRIFYQIYPLYQKTDDDDDDDDEEDDD